MRSGISIIKIGKCEKKFYIKIISLILEFYLYIILPENDNGRLKE